MSVRVNKAVVVGGGIGGLAAALGLRRAGWTVTLLERAPAFRSVGAGIALAPNAVRAMTALGLGTELRAKGMAQGAAGLRAASGRWMMKTELEELERRYGVPSFALHRADLHQMLAEALGEVDIRTAHFATGLSGDNAVTYDGPAGTGDLAADLIVAADGIHSALRRQLFPGHPGPTYAGYVTWRGVVPAADAPRSLPRSLTETWGRGRRFGIVPLADGRVYWYATHSLPEGVGKTDTVADVASRYRGWHDPIPQLLAVTPQDALLRNDIFSLESPLPSYVAGRVVLLGDAAHAVTPDLGQGAAQALEDAVTLAAVVASGGELAAYDEQRRPRTQKLVRASAQVGRVAQWRHPLAALARDTVAALMPVGTYLRSSADTLSWQPPDPS